MMKIVLTSYVFTKSFSSPEAWLTHIRFYTGTPEALAARGHDVISIEQIDYAGARRQNAVSYRFLNFSRAGRIFPFKLHLFIKKQKPDVVIIQGLHSPLQVILLRLQTGAKTKIILQNHGEKPFTGIKRSGLILADKVVDAYLFASLSLGLTWATKGLISATKIHEVMEVSSLFRPINRSEALRYTEASGKPSFLWVGRLNENKDPMNVIKGFLRFADKQPGAKLYMIYQTEELLPKVKVLLANHLYRKVVFLVGKVNNDDLLSWYNSADFLISGSHYEGSGTAVCEAMSCGCIPVITDIPSFRMITNNGDCGILYPAGDEDALVDALRKTQTINIESYRQKCMDWFDQKLSFKAIARDIEAVANSIIK